MGKGLKHYIGVSGLLENLPAGKELGDSYLARTPKVSTQPKLGSGLKQKIISGCHKTLPDTSQIQTVKDHLMEVMEYAHKFHPLAGLAGLWHDLGKFNPQWQKYLLDDKVSKSPGHSLQGAYFAAIHSNIAPVAYAILGHHAGLYDAYEAKSKLRGAKQLWNDIEDIAIAQMGNSLTPNYSFDYHKGEEELLTRMIFSALVDADRISAAKFSNNWEQSIFPSIMQLHQQFTAKYYLNTVNKPKTKLNVIRQKINSQCVKKSNDASGFFKLTAPTGAGKTLSSLNFALNHALKHGKDRIIYCPPFTSIIEQSSKVFREYLGDAVLEHHSEITLQNREEYAQYELMTARWEHPVIVSSTIQFFESLFSNKPSKCRKNYHIANSVIILDEVQALPIQFLSPIMRMLKNLVKHWGCTVVFSSATQVYYDIAGISDTSINEIIPNHEEYFTQLERVEYIYHQNPISWQDVLTHLKQQNSNNALIVVNTRKDARDGYAALEPLGNVYHLSKNMYSKHRKRVLAEVKDRLRDGKPCYLISTQLIEAGVDISFDLGYRVLTGLDSIIQTAGRINREGKSPKQPLHIFDLVGGGTYYGNKEKVDITKQLLIKSSLPHKLIQSYYQSLLSGWGGKLDLHKINTLMDELKFKTIADKFKLIEEGNEKEIIIWCDETEGLIQKLLNNELLNLNETKDLWSYAVSYRGDYHYPTIPSLNISYTKNYDKNTGLYHSRTLV
jgi:CRISPR-associated endonuclease/helicase Cas3